MKLTAHDAGVIDITADELRAHMQASHADNYLLIDVRQPEEYQREHIPGAMHIPLLELQQRADEVGREPDTNRIFYCHSGGRSRRAANLFGEAMGVANVFNLVGGISAYNGRTLADLPVLMPFVGKGTAREVLLEAINLEKGADRLYSALADHFQGSAIEGTIRAAARAEQDHGRAVYQALERLGEGVVEDFDTLYASLPGDVLEGGASLEQMLEAAKAAANQGNVALLDLALDLELSAYDMYRTLAHRADTESRRQAFMALAEQEKSHARALTSAIVRVTAAT